MKLRKLNRAVHRDLGYFFFGMCIIYGISGIAMNHKHHWNPNYIITVQDINLELPTDSVAADRELALYFLTQLNEQDKYRNHMVSGSNMRIFVQGGRVMVDMETGAGQLETNRRRPILFQTNFLHYNAPKKLWTWFADMFAVSLILLAVSGLFILKGKNGITRRGAWLTAAGIIIPLVLLFLYL